MRPQPPEPRSSALLQGALILLVVWLAGCTLRADKQANVPPPPKPAAVQPSVPEPPLSIPQTAVTLPSLQPVSPDAIPKPETAQAPAPEKTEATAAQKVPHRTAGPPKKSDEAEAGPEPPPAPPPQEQERIQPILSSTEQQRIAGDIDARKKEIAERRSHAKHLSSHDQSLVERIKSFLLQCEQAEQHGDFSQADALSERALLLARELPSE
jgi:hypothetical protein